jgi:hypothetical protein
VSLSRIAIAYQDHPVMLYDRASGAQLCHLQPVHPTVTEFERATAVALLDDETHAAIGTVSGSLTVADCTSGAPLHAWHLPGRVTCAVLAVAASGIAAATHGGFVSLVDCRSPEAPTTLVAPWMPRRGSLPACHQPLHSFPRPSPGVGFAAVKLSPCRNYLFAQQRGRSLIHVTDLRAPAAPVAIIPTQGPTFDVGVANGAVIVLAPTSDNLEVSVFDVNAGKPLGTTRGILGDGHANPETRGRIVAVAANPLDARWAALTIHRHYGQSSVELAAITMEFDDEASHYD